MNNEFEKLFEQMCADGREITLTVKVIDARKAYLFYMGLFDDKYAKKSGVKIIEWYMEDALKANIIKLKTISYQIKVLSEEADKIINADNKEYLGDW